MGHPQLLGLNIIVSLAILEQHPYSDCLQHISSLNVSFNLVFNTLVLINGGAVVSLLGFMGATISKGLSSSLGANLTHPLLYFGIGVLAGALAFGGRY
jgi:hypothetical protein